MRRACMGFAVVDGKLRLSWSQTGFVLQQNGNLQDPAGWSNVPQGDVSPVVIDLATTGPAPNYYRLKKP